MINKLKIYFSGTLIIIENYIIINIFLDYNWLIVYLYFNHNNYKLLNQFVNVSIKFVLAITLIAFLYLFISKRKLGIQRSI